MNDQYRDKRQRESLLDSNSCEQKNEEAYRR